MDLPNELPSGDFLEYFGPDFTLHPQVERDTGTVFCDHATKEG